MGKKAKRANKAKRDSAKRQRREANRMRYVGLIGTTSNKKKKHGRSASTNKRKHAHAVHNCGNPGCSRCYPSLNSPALASPTSSIYGRRWSSTNAKLRVIALGTESEVAP